MATPDESINSAKAGPPGQPGATGKSRSLMKWALVILPLGFLWFRLIDNLWGEWDTNPQYSYGLVVPLLVIGLLLRRCLPAENRTGKSVAGNPWPVVILCCLLAFFFLPTRLIGEATPEWRPIQWLMAIETVGLTLYAIYLAGGKGWLKLAAFPVLFFLVAVPWPSPIETPLIQGLSRLNASMVVEVMAVLNVPAIQHGNTIEVSTGVVGINDACSGIRSFQSSLMISLFLGEFYLFNWRRRALLLPVGFALAMGLNVCRASLLTWIAAKKGVDAIATYHDEAGLSILVACTGLLWGMAWLMNRWKKSPETKSAGISGGPVPSINHDMVMRRVNRLGIALIVWLVAVESGVELWYRVREARITPAPDWTINFPTNNPTFKVIPPTDAENTLLRFDEAKKGQWEGPDGTTWQGFYFNWKPGRVSAYLAKRHTPDICITATGLQMASAPDLKVLDVNGVQLPMRHYVFDSASGPLQVYQCRWDAAEGESDYTVNESSRFNLVRGIWTGRGNKGQKVLEFILIGYHDPEEAGRALAAELPKLIKVESPVKSAD